MFVEIVCILLCGIHSTYPAAIRRDVTFTTNQLEEKVEEKPVLEQNVEFDRLKNDLTKEFSSTRASEIAGNLMTIKDKLKSIPGSDEAIDGMVCD